MLPVVFLAIRPTELWSTTTLISSAVLALVVAVALARILFVVTASYDREP